MKTEQEIKDRIKKIENEIKILQSEKRRYEKLLSCDSTTNPEDWMC
jgi:hypothetical protein